MTYNKSGFTLVELLVTISIIATLIGILVPNLMGARERARDASKKEDLSAIKNALRMYYNDTQNYPAGGASFAAPAQGQAINGLIVPYLPSAANIGFSFSYLGGGDTFFAWAAMDATREEENFTSQKRCGVGVGSTRPGNYMVCAQ